MKEEANVLESIFESPRMPELAQEIQVRWKDEQRLREEFYKKIQPGDKWEFINGKIIMHSPAKEKHTAARQKLSLLLQIFTSLHDLGIVRDETSLVTLTRNDYLPDILFFRKEKAAVFTPDTWKYPMPDFVVEVLSDSTEGTDRGIKKSDYATHGAQEYWLVDTDLQLVEQYLLDETKKEFWLFTKKTIGDQLTCQAVPGFNIPVAAIFDEQVKMEVAMKWMLEKK